MDNRSKTRRGIVYLRRSTAQQEESLEQQLRWAMDKATRLGIDLSVTREMLATAQRNGIVQVGNLFFDTKPGVYTNRPGFVAFHKVATDPKNGITDCLFYARDRFARPEMAELAVSLEKQILQAGKRTITTGLCCESRQRFEDKMGEDITLFIEYSAAGRFRPDLAKKVLRAFSANARRGYPCGGKPPYGFVRALLNTKTGIIDRRNIEGLKPSGDFKVVWVPGSDSASKEKLKIVRRIHNTYASGVLGLKSIAKQLTEEGIPPPDPERKRRDASGSPQWSNTTVSNILSQPLYMGRSAFGRRWEGNILRYDPSSPGGSRPATLDEVRDGHKHGHVKVHRDHEQWTYAEEMVHHIDPVVPPEVWQQNNERLKTRRDEQGGRGRKCYDPSRYPLPLYCGACGRRMTGMQLKARDGSLGPLMYVCSNYQTSGGHKCTRNRVPRDVVVWFAVHAIRRLIAEKNHRKVLADAVKRGIQSTAVLRADTGELDRMRGELRELERQRKQAYADRLQAVDDDEREDAAEAYDKINRRVKSLRAELESKNVAAASNSTPMESEVRATMDVLDKLHLFLEKVPENRLPETFQALGARMVLKFETREKNGRVFTQPVGGELLLNYDPSTGAAGGMGEGVLKMGTRGDRI